MKLLTKLLLLASLAFGSLAFASPAPNQEAPEAPDVLVKRITMQVLDTAKSDKEIKAGNRKRIHELVETMILPHVDFQRTTALTVGRYWREATPQQKQQLTDEFRALLMYTYAGALSQVGDQKVVFKPLRADPADNDVEVRFEVIQPRRADPVQVSYRLYKTPDGWKVYDVNVLGVWLVQTYKENFAAEIGKGGIDGLIRTLAEKNRSLAEHADEGAKAAS
ncbi:MAG TPA: ABC transporter substrate-binding protein [Noviherbaspirillum sp.]|uniref:MlaC/ttg2D family ABC transporter substrate-binding protein n=1 Tax=Noviherbaspirillum sp. TaxID=1926288 RepID=UPI002B471372|nr:ABC transporter substrate-binding protein [Noviherbaspirillum sp.]HJV86404.1 ABC transporter substrate-binding protein [Noviherbaspirillum sp.]